MVLEFEIPGHIEVHEGHLFIGGADTVELADGFGTPLYITNEARVRENFRRMQKAFGGADLLYAVKANGNLALLKVFASEGAGADVFSAGELHLALLAGIQREKILFNGNSKSIEDLRAAVQAGVMVSVDSPDEMEALAEVADEVGRNTRVAFRVNPAVSPNTHPKIATGLRDSKFGITAEDAPAIYEKALELDRLEPVGIHCHIGSQILETAPFVEAVERVFDVVDVLFDKGITLEFIDMGSGLGIPYEKDKPVPTPEELASAMLPVFERRAEALGYLPRLILEPGRYVVGDSTVLLTRVNTVKRAFHNFVGVDAGFNLLMRPVMYGAYHHVVVANKAEDNPVETYHVVGPICESGDILAKDRHLPVVERGDLIAVMDTGAYGFSMSSQYNGRPRCAEVLVLDGHADLTRRHEDIGDILATQRVPERLL
ncbi:MAG: diaminopimelate decarboxylase [Methermicoccaceae archaeon]